MRKVDKPADFLLTVGGSVARTCCVALTTLKKKKMLQWNLLFKHARLFCSIPSVTKTYIKGEQGPLATDFLSLQLYELLVDYDHFIPLRQRHNTRSQIAGQQ